MSTNYWSGEPIVAERKDLHAANCMAVDRSGQLAVLAGRRQVSLVDLQHPRDTVHALHWQHKYDAGTAAWSRAACDTHSLAVSYNNQVSMLRLAAGEGGGGGLQLLQESRRLQSHRRGITDLDWHWREPLLATSSVDASIHVWDARDLRRTAAVMSSVETASQVKWNRMSDFTLASSHEGDIRVWDTRKLNIPERYISAHTAKIHSLDWSPNQEHELVTAGQDMYVKFIDVTNPHAVVSMTKSKDPVWRARYTPFGSALVTVGVLPHLRRGDNCPCLWNTDSLTTPVHTFMGHTDVVLEFDWRYREAEADYELITWSRDQSLRLWQVEHHLLQLCGHQVVLPAPGLDNTDLHQYTLLDDNVFVEAATPPEPTTTACPNGGAGDAPVHVPPPSAPVSPPFARSRRAASEGPLTAPVTLPRTLQQEFAMVNKNIDNVRIENLDPRRRTCQVSVGCGPLALSLLVTFPASYPSIVPEMKVLEETGLSEEDRLHVRRCWRLTAEQHVKRNSSCLEPCLRTLATELQSRAARGSEFKTTTVPPQYPDSLQATASVFPSGNLYGNFKDMNVPFPRTSGARFCGNGTLVVFACPAYMKRLSTRGDNATPRSLSALDAYLMNYTQSGTVARGIMTANALLYPSLSRSPTTTDSPLQARVAASSLGRRLKPSSSTVGVTTGLEVRPAVRSASSTPAAVSAAAAAAAAVTASSAAAAAQQMLPALVICYDCSRLALLSPQLAVQYRLPSIRASTISTAEGAGGRGVSFRDTCGQNAMRAAAAGRRDLERLWKLVGVACEPSATPTADAEPDAARPWAQHVFGRQLVERLLDHYLKLRDIQTVAMLLCTVGTRTRPVYCTGRRSPAPHDEHSSGTGRWWTKPGESPYHTVHPTESRRYPALHSLTFGAGPGRQNRSNSWTDDITSAGLALQQSTAAGGATAAAAQAVGCSELAVPDGSAAERKQRQHENNCKILDPSRQIEFDNYIRIYASLLYKWQLLNQRAQVLKYVTAAPAGSQYGIELRSECGRCGHVFTGPECSTCKRYSITCAVCHTPVRGMSAFCLSCGHGGHLLHMWQWFESQPVCPAGCPCKCLHTFQSTFEAI